MEASPAGVGEGENEARRRVTALFARGAFASIALWMAAAWGARYAGLPRLAAALDLPFLLACHRLPERTASILGAPMPVCSRCAGLYLGLSLGVVLAAPVLPLRVLRLWLPLALALLLVELVTQELGLHPVWHGTRVASGLLVSVPFGGALGGLLVRELGPVFPRGPRRPRGPGAHLPSTAEKSKSPK